jgi:hypothetical protein
MKSDLQPNRAEAEQHLAALDPSPDAAWVFQTFTDSKKLQKERAEENKLRKKQGKPPRKDPLAAWRYGTLAEHWEWLVKQQQRGAGVYITVNQTDGGGRKKTNITRIRAVFLDLDGSPIEPVNNAEVKPHIVIESSPDRFHCYWRFIGRMPIKVFEPLQKGLAARFKGDESVCDSSRVMRLAGFFHAKDAPFRSRIVAINGSELHRASILLKTFRPAKVWEEEKPEPEPKPQPRPQHDELRERWKKLNSEAVRRYSDWVPDIFPTATKTSEGGYRVTSADLGRDLEEDLSFHAEGIKDFGVHDMATRAPAVAHRSISSSSNAQGFQRSGALAGGEAQPRPTGLSAQAESEDERAGQRRPGDRCRDRVLSQTLRRSVRPRAQGHC